MGSEESEKVNYLDVISRDDIKQLFKRKIDVDTVVHLNDSVKTRNWINQRKENEAKQKLIQVAFNEFNPDTHVVVTKEQLNITEQLKTLIVIGKQVGDLHKNKFTPIEDLVESVDISAKLTEDILSRKPRITIKNRNK